MEHPGCYDKGYEKKITVKNKKYGKSGIILGILTG
jgi:hypothetical protein